MFAMVVVVVLASGLTSEQRLYPMPTASMCESALKASLATWEAQKARIVTAKCERIN